MSCIWSNSLNVFNSLLEAIRQQNCQQIIFHEADIISIADNVQRKSVGDIMLNTRFMHIRIRTVIYGKFGKRLQLTVF